MFGAPPAQVRASQMRSLRERYGDLPEAELLRRNYADFEQACEGFHEATKDIPSVEPAWVKDRLPDVDRQEAPQAGAVEPLHREAT